MLGGSGDTCVAQTSLFDRSFASGSGADLPVNSVVVDQQGQIWVGGEFQMISGQSNAYLARLNPNGTVIAPGEFSADGPVHRLAIQSDGKVLVAGAFSNLLGHAKCALARFHSNGTLDTSFDASNSLGANSSVFTLSIQPDGRILAATEYNNMQGCRVFRLLSDGQPDPDFANTNIFAGQVFTFATATSNAILAGGTFIGYNATGQTGLALMQSNGVIISSWSNHMAGMPSVFTLLTQENGGVLVGGHFQRVGQQEELLGRLTPDLQWDGTFATDEFGRLSGLWNQKVTTLLLQPDGALVVGGGFYEVGGYNRRHLVRLTPKGRVDPCFDPGLGLGGTDEVRSMARQTNGCILVGGNFQGVDGVNEQANIAKAFPQGECNATRVHLVRIPNNDALLALGTFPPGGTNYLERSTNLVDWVAVDSGTNYYVQHFEFSGQPTAFFRVRKQY